MEKGTLNNPTTNTEAGISSPSSSNNSNQATGVADSETDSIDESAAKLAKLFQVALLRRLFELRGSESAEAPTVEALGNMISKLARYRLPRQESDGIAIPDDHNQTSVATRYFEHTRTDYDEDILVLTSIPLRPLTGPGDDPDGHSEWLVRGPTKAKVVNAPEYLQPVPKPKSAKPAYVIKSTPNMGNGLFATRDIKMGELIFAERPLLVIPSSNASVLGHLEALHPEPGKHFDLETMKEMAMTELEKWLKIAFDRMEPEDKEEFMQLANSHEHDGSGPLYGIMRTNGFGTRIYDGDELRADNMNTYTGATKIGSRLNHSCMPNVNMDFSQASFSFQFMATVDIKAGEELTYSYCYYGLPVAERHAKLAPYGFVCHCPACEHATPETDALRRECEARAKHYLLNLNWAGKGGAKESVIEPVMRLRDELVKEGLTFLREYKSVLLMLWKFYQGIGMDEKAKPYREEYGRYKTVKF